MTFVFYRQKGRRVRAQIHNNSQILKVSLPFRTVRSATGFFKQQGFMK